VMETDTGESGETETSPAEESAGNNNEAGSESDTGDETPTSSTSRQSEEVDVTDQEAGTRTTTPGTTGTGNRPGTQKTGAAPAQVESDSEESDDTEEPVAEELPPDNPPVAVDDVLQVDSAGSREISAFLLKNDRDADAGQTPRIVGISGEGSRGGTVSFANGRVTYTPDADQLGSLGAGNTATETFTYRVQTGDLTDSATLTVRLVGSNRAPVAQDDSAVAVEDSPITINVIGNDTDPDGDSLSVISVDGGRGTISNSSSAGLRYTPPDDLRAGEVITDTFTYTVSDGELTSTATVSVTVTGRNDPPVINTTAEPFEVQASAGPTEIPLSAIFADSDLGDQLTVVSIDTSGTRSTVTIGSIIVDPGDAWDFLARGEIGTDSFGVTVRDEFNATGSGRYTFEVIGVNDAPVANADQYSLIGGEPNRIDEKLGLLANDTDVDNGAELTVSAITTRPASGALSFAADGSFVYTPADGFLGTDQFVYQVTDEFGAVSSARVTLNVGATNEPPVANPDQFTISNSGVVTGNLLANDLDQEGEPITASLATPPANGTVSVSVDGSFTYAPEPDFTGTDTFTYEVSDSGGRTSEGTVTVEVLGQNEPPVATSPGNQSIAVDESFSLDLNSVFSDPEGTPLVYSFSSTSGLVTLSGATLIIDPAGANAGDAFDVVVSASDGENTTSTSFSVDVVSGNSPPELVAPISPISIAEGGNLVVGLGSRFTDPDGDPLTIFSSGQPAFVTLSGNSLSITPQSGDAGTYSIVVGADDGQSTATTSFSLTVTPPVLPPNVAPVITAPASISLIEDTSFSPVISISDADAGTDPILVSLSGPGAISITGPASLYGSTQLGSSTLGQGVAPGGEIFIRFDLVDASFKNAVSPAGVFMYTAGAQIAADSIVDGGAAGDSSFTARFVSPAADPFAPWSFTYFNTQLQTFSPGGTFDAAFYNTAADALAESNEVASERGVPFSFSNYQLEGTVDDVNTTLTSLSVQPFADFNTATSAATFSIFVNDLGNNGGAPATSSASIQLDITPVPDPPQANDIFYGNYVEDYTGVISINASLYSYDPDGDPLTVTAIDGNAILANQTVLVANGSVTLQADSQTLEFEADAEYSGPISFGYTISDGSSTAAATITLTITPVNDSPEITAPASITTLEDQSFSPAVSISDVDAGSGNIQVEINAPGEIFISGPVSLAGFVNTYALLNQSVAAGNEVFIRFDYGNATIKSAITVADIWIFNNGGQLFADSITAGGGVGETFVTARFVSPVADPFTTFSSANVVAELENISSIVTRDAAVYNTSADALAQSNAASTDLGVPLAFNNYQLTGTVADINTALGTLSVQPFPDTNTGTSTANLFVSANDLGNSGGPAALSSVVIPVNITPVNDLPVAINDSLGSYPEDYTGTITLNPTLNDYDPELAPLTITGIDGNSVLPNGSVAVANGTVTLLGDGQTLEFQADTNYFGAISFDYAVSDGSATATATVSLSLIAVNDPPVADAESFTVLEGEVATEANLDVGTSLLDGDTDVDGDTLIATTLSAPAFASAFTLNPDGTFSYTHDGSANFTDSFVYRISDGLNTDTATVSITVTQTPFLISPDFDTVIINARDSISLPIGFSDPDFDALTTSAIGLPGWASVSTSIPSPPGDAVISGTAVTGTSTVTVSATDGVGTATETFVLDAQASADLQVGTAGNDLFLGSDGNDTIQGGAGDDEILYAGNQSDYTYTATYSAGVVTITVTDNVGTDGVDVISGVESIQFADGPLSGPLTINGSSLADTITGSQGADIINGNNGSDIIDGLGGNDTIDGGALDDNLVGGDGDDVIYGGIGADVLTGGSGNDVLDGNDAGNLGDTEIDIAVFSGNRSDYDISPDPLLAGATGTLTFTVTDLVGSDGTDTVSDIERLQFADMTIDLPYDLRGSSLADVLTGASLADYIVAINGDDTVNGLAGDDYVDAGGGDDTVDGGDGIDVLLGGSGADNLTGGPGNDFIDGNDGSSLGDAGIDVAHYSGSRSDYTISVNGAGTSTTVTVTHNLGLDGTDTLEDIDQLQFADLTLDLPRDLRGSSGADILVGGAEHDHIVGIGGDDTITGAGGGDYIDAGDGADSIDGGAGFDYIIGGNGVDTLIDLSASASIDLSGVTNLADFEVIDLADGDGNDVLSLGLTDILSFVGDNSLDSILPDGQTKLIINGDSGDVVNLDANTLGLATDFGELDLDNGWSAPNDSSELDYFGNGSSYVLFSNGIVDVYVHADMFAPI
ncbi:MAG: Ig-like domain-containing protein, partial [Proteobacteria bacterium]|nr:Ig-like domain-containing protein [Pseudomonadota bacterium]